MKISRAIEIKSLPDAEFLNTDRSELDEADRLSIEALRAIQRHRHDTMPAKDIILKGETKEEES